MVKYSSLKRYLIELGFIDESVPQSHLAFRHDESGTVVLLSLQADDDEPVRQEDLVSVRRHLVENQLIGEKEFSRFVSTGGKFTRKRR